MTGHQGKILRAERRIRKIEKLRESIPDRMRACLPDGTDMGREDIKGFVAFLTTKMDEDLAAMRRELAELRATQPK